jgi:hypothetical protein
LARSVTAPAIDLDDEPVLGPHRVHELTLDVDVVLRLGEPVGTDEVAEVALAR